jgi:hypothetical protein
MRRISAGEKQTSITSDLRSAAIGAKRPFIRKTASGPISRQMVFKQTIEEDIVGSAGVVKGGSAPPLLLADTLYVLRQCCETRSCLRQAIISWNYMRGRDLGDTAHYSVATGTLGGIKRLVGHLHQVR